jgi:hypothetical protein
LPRRSTCNAASASGPNISPPAVIVIAVMVAHRATIQYTIIGAPNDPPMNIGVVAFNSCIQEQREPTDNLDHFCIGA